MFTAAWRAPGRAIHCRSMPEEARVAHRVAAAANAELAADRRQREHRGRRVAAVAVALEAPAAADQRRASIARRDPPSSRRRSAGSPLPRRRARWSTARRVAQASAPCVCAPGTPGRRGLPRRDTRWMRQRHRQVGAGTDREVEIGLLGQRRGARIDHDERRAAALRFLRKGTRWMPEADGLTPHRMISFACGVVLVDDRRPSCRRAPMLAAPVGAAQTVVASRDVPRRRHRLASFVVLREQAVGAAVVVGQDRFAAVLPGSRHPARRSSRALRPRSRARMCPCPSRPGGPRGRAADPPRRRARRSAAPWRRCSRA